MPDNFSFSEADHVYRLDGSPIPGFSEILKDVGIVDLSGIPHDILEKARQRGTFVHQATQYLEEGTLDWDTITHSDIRNRILAWARFIEQEGFKSVLMEKPIYHRVFRYGVTPDRLGLIDGGTAAVVEIKNTANQASYWKYQTAAQVHALWSHGAIDCAPEKVLRFAVNLKGDGTYHVQHHHDDSDFKCFLAALTVYNMKRG